jgi:hypothetical protein
VALLEHFTKLRTRHLRRALARWSEWEAHETRGKLRATLAPKPEAETVEVPEELPVVVEAEANGAQVAGEQMRQGL